MVKLVFLAIIFSVILFALKNVNSDLFVPALVACGVIFAFYLLSYVKEAFSFINQVIEMTGVDSELYKIIFKIVGISYLIEFGAGTVEDVGYKSIADKLTLIGKLAIFISSLPVFYAVINLLVGLAK